MLKHFRQYSLLRTDILQKTVFGCPWKNSVHWLYSVVVIPRELSRREIWNKSKTENARYARYKRRKGFFKSVLEKMTYSSVVMGRDPFNQNFRKFRSKPQWIGSVQPEKFRKNRSTFWGGPLFPVGPVWILVEWIAPMERNYSSLTQGLWGGGRCSLRSVTLGKALYWGPTPYPNHVLYTVFDRKGTPFLYLLLAKSTPFTYLF